MGKAYTESEREAIRTRLLEAGLELFHDDGVRSISIRELTRRAGIAQGGFYRFFSDKDAFVIELIHYRTRQKLALFEQSRARSLSNPAGFVSRSIFAFSWGLKQRAEKKQMYADILRLCLAEQGENQERLYAVMRTTLENLAAYWAEQGLSLSVDIRGLLNVIKGSLLLYAGLDRLDRDYAEPLLRAFIEAGCQKFITDGPAAQKERTDDTSL